MSIISVKSSLCPSSRIKISQTVKIRAAAQQTDIQSYSRIYNITVENKLHPSTEVIITFITKLVVLGGNFTDYIVLEAASKK